MIKKSPLSAIIIFVGFVFLPFLTSCSNDVKQISTNSTIQLNYLGSQIRTSPQTIPIKSTSSIQVDLSLVQDVQRALELKELQWSLQEDTTEAVAVENGSLIINEPRTSAEFEITADVLWKSSKSSYRETIKQTIHLALAQKKKPESRKIDEYPVGHLPTIQSDLVFFGSRPVVSRDEIPYFQEYTDTAPAGFLSSGKLLDRLTPADSTDFYRTTHEDSSIYVKRKDLSPPAIIRNNQHYYNPPEWYFPVTNENREGVLIPGIRWKQFDHDQYYRLNSSIQRPHYIPLEKSILKKLQGIKKLLKKENLPTGINLISGSRNPHYNQNEARSNNSLKAVFSRHQYGDAVDFIVDSNRDNIMDDLNQDGKIDFKDARILGNLANQWEKLNNKPGGIGVYSHHDVGGRKQTPYVHIDTRNFRARWYVR